MTEFTDLGAESKKEIGKLMSKKIASDKLTDLTAEMVADNIEYLDQLDEEAVIDAISRGLVEGRQMAQKRRADAEPKDDTDPAI
ncbi:hypothetical protein [Microbacterium sp. BH-3-3-3]|uniref:hypothetical protein n=1 Tax=Microbacterium sp. BH-3-3-3 TaxID=1906742 RepID=UPI000892A31F|nr:hypothetical protein [Microbacterium sp. BH-3-3-3]AOX46709.1 hypothetical protein BJP65_13645 [Microbacterium sp. BH-3-3-3]